MSRPTPTPRPLCRGSRPGCAAPRRAGRPVPLCLRRLRRLLPRPAGHCAVRAGPVPAGPEAAACRPPWWPRPFCRETAGLLPGLCLKPSRRTGNCPFFEANACTVHEARPLACALYPLGQAIDLDTGLAEYYLQPPLCGARAGERDGVRTLAHLPGRVRRAGTGGGGQLSGRAAAPGWPAAWPLCRAAPGCRPSAAGVAAGAVLRLRFPGRVRAPAAPEPGPAGRPAGIACRAETSGGARPALRRRMCILCGRPSVRDGFLTNLLTLFKRRPEIIENNKKITKRT